MLQYCRNADTLHRTTLLLQIPRSYPRIPPPFSSAINLILKIMSHCTTNFDLNANRKQHMTVTHIHWLRCVNGVSFTNRIAIHLKSAEMSSEFCRCRYAVDQCAYKPILKLNVFTLFLGQYR